MMRPLTFNRRALLAAAAAMTVAPLGRAEEAPGTEETRLWLEQGRYLPLLTFYRDLAETDPAMSWMAAQLAAMAGDEDAAFELPPAPTLPPLDLTGCRTADALDTIVAAARNRQIVILNEAHHASRCRAFAGLVAARLAGEGFSVFAAETFANATRPSAAAEALNGGAPVTPALGWYLADPVYAETVRAARRRGYRFAAYEARAAQVAGTSGAQQLEAREDGEANNFIADILERNPKARVFVTCGYDHLRKAEAGDGRMWFAARLKAKTGIDPLCISQSWGVPPPDPAREPLALKAILDQFSPAAPVVVFDHNNEALRHSAPKAAVDLEVVHPRLAQVDGRPGWLAALPGRNKMRFTMPGLVDAYSVVQAVPAGENTAPNAVPSDQYPLKLGAREAVFFLTEGPYEIRLETDDGRSVLGQLKV